MGSLGACIAFVKKTNWIFVCVCNELLSTLFNREVECFYILHCVFIYLMLMRPFTRSWFFYFVQSQSRNVHDDFTVKTLN